LKCINTSEKAIIFSEVLYMKRSKNKYIGIFSCFVLAAVFAVTLSVKAPKTDDEAKNETAQNTQEDMSLVSQEDYSQVSLNKNAPDKSSVKEETKTQPKQQETTTETKTETETNSDVKQQEEQKGTYEYDEAEETVLSDDELVFAVPVSGEITMDYSKDKLVYDATLDQYRTNESICYAAEEGTVVGAAAQGTVESITKDKKSGTSVTIFHGDGWRTTYSQLSDDVAVAQGDIVEKGQTIGYVGTPGTYSAALGSHLEFKMTLDGNSVDPKTALVE
jgi:murein DD-endopeptidase MepM/ murein hydrolase activator NlpD